MSDSALFPTYARFPITLVKGKGSRLWDDQGKEYLDFASGLAVTNLGHVPDAVKNALVKQLDELWHMSNLFSNPNQEKAARLLADNSCADTVFFCNSGAEANEAAIKLARRYHQKVRGEERYEVITFTQSFHGRTLATLTATGQDKVKEGFLPLPAGFVHVPLHDLKALEAAVNDRTAAVMLELVQAEGGVIPVDPDFLREVRKLCDKHGLLLILDEIQTGMGRTGKLFAHQHYDVEPDVFTLAKGIASGFPVGAMLAKEKFVPAFTAGSHATTFGGTPIAMAAVIATIETMLKENAPQKAAEAGDYLTAQLRASLQDVPGVIEVRGKGLLIGILCDAPVSEQIGELHRRGLLVVPAGPNVIRLLPNLLVTHEEIDAAVSLIAAVLTEKAAAKQA
ncbi:acetylornithine transaminase [Cohnella faecalis]|uniref:Acetylornithine aminotransferase n=1 Tax=Cohnella faecalis TaxID=2315694 RepID=A0A398CT15_9BACL|nr:acetylornithine transaminase [Cohnella faecalis]RIE02104.1 acetylornithine transaminase [Cohnella faecalis]